MFSLHNNNKIFFKHFVMLAQSKISSRTPSLQRLIQLRSVASIHDLSKENRNGNIRYSALFGLKGLIEPKDFLRLAKDAVLSTNTIRKQLDEAPPTDPVKILEKLDEISNRVCQVIDVAEFCRSVHSDSAFREGAEEAFMHLAEYIQDLNGDTSLYSVLCSVADDPAIMADLTEEQQRMAVLLKSEFERDGIHLPLEQRQLVAQLQNEITRIETAFNQNIVTKQGSIQVPRSVLRHLSKDFLSKVPQPPGQSREIFTLPTHSHISNTILKYIQDSSTRKSMYIATNTAARENVEVLELLVRYRHKLAQVLGFDSYAGRFLSDKMITSPAQVINFLEELSHQLQPKSSSELQMMSDAKFQAEGERRIRPWDLPFYMGALKSQKHDLDGWTIASYFPLQNCLDGLAMICKELFGIEMKQVDVPESEDWAPCHDGAGLRKLELSHPEEGFLGTIYLDLHPREGKYTHAAHFTLQCGFQNQLPIVALVCNFVFGNARSNDGRPISLLSHGEVETLFHEFGHALHSLVSRTQFQHLSGTRGPLDFVEVPSHLMEHFVWDKRVLSRFANHYQTGEPIPEELVDSLTRSKNMFAGTDSQTQILYALLDQKFFGPHSDTSRLALTQLAAALQQQITSVDHEDGTYWHARFGHFTGYGAGYYGYLYSKALAACMWKELFAEDPLNRKNGNKLWKNLLIHGNARSPQNIIESIIGTKGNNFIHSFTEEIEICCPHAPKSGSQ